METKWPRRPIRRAGGVSRQREMGETMAAKPGSVAFEATVTATGNNTGIVVPDEVIEQLAAVGDRPC